MDRAFVGDFKQMISGILIQGVGQDDGTVDALDHSGPGLTVGAILGVDLGVFEGDADLLEGNASAIRVHPHSHRGAGAECCQDQIVGGRTGTSSALSDWLVSAQRVTAADRDGLGEFSGSGLAHHYRAFWCLDRRRNDCRDIEMASRPGGDHVGGKNRILALR